MSEDRPWLKKDLGSDSGGMGSYIRDIHTRIVFCFIYHNRIYIYIYFFFLRGRPLCWSCGPSSSHHTNFFLSCLAHTTNMWWHASLMVVPPAGFTLHLNNKTNYFSSVSEWKSSLHSSTQCVWDQRHLLHKYQKTPKAQIVISFALPMANYEHPIKPSTFHEFLWVSKKITYVVNIFFFSSV